MAQFTADHRQDLRRYPGAGETQDLGRQRGRVLQSGELRALTPTLSPQAGRGRSLNSPSPRFSGERARVSGRVRGCEGLRGAASEAAQFARKALASVSSGRSASALAKVTSFP